MYTETEWGFPKGRRNINETDLTCAIREFNEETSIPVKHIRIAKNINPIDEVFSGSNKVRYKHVYFIACYTNERHYKRTYNPNNKMQVREIKNAEWFKYHDAQKKNTPTQY